ncbi:aspartate aminotransferase family protein [bacterium]|nr:aspartate aminotransferase family protein [bacterium]
MAYHGVPKSNALYDRALEILPGGTQLFSRRADRFVPGVTPMYLERAEGVHLWDVDGNEYLDFGMGCGPVILGHAYPAVTEAVIAQAQRGNCLTVNSPLEIELAELLIDLVPCAEMVRFLKCGGETNAAAVRIARGYTGRDVVLFCGYHGWHDWYLAANLLGPDTLNGHLLPGLDTRGVPQALQGTTIPFEYNNLDSLRAALEQNRGRVGCIMLEAARSKRPAPGFLEGVRALADEYGAVLIFDEVVTGFRLALGGAQEYFGVTPDLCTFAKALSNGIPLGAVCGRRDIMASAATMFISSTYFSDTIGLAAGVATLTELRDRPVIPHLWAMGERLQEGLRALAARHGLAFHCDGFPPVLHMGFDEPDEHQRVVMTTVYLQELVKRGILCLMGAYLSYSHTPEDIDAYLQAADEAFGVIKQGLAAGDLQRRCEGGLWGQHFRRLV